MQLNIDKIMRLITEIRILLKPMANFRQEWLKNMPFGAHTLTAYTRQYFPWELFSQSYILTQANTHKPLAV